jgi:hypothetical protein
VNFTAWPPNKEARMTTDEGSPNGQMIKGPPHICSFGFRHSFVIGHSAFVIYSWR